MKVHEYGSLEEWHELCERGCWCLVPDDGRVELFRHYPMDMLVWPEECLTGYDWAAAVMADPSLETRCRFDKMTDATWCRLIEERPKLASVPLDQRQVDAMSEASARRGKALDGRAVRTGAEWVGMLKEDVNASFCCDWDKLSGDDWVDLLSAIWPLVKDSSKRMFLLFWGAGMLAPAIYGFSSALALCRCMGVRPFLLVMAGRA